jgi:hypothetical protein
MDTLELHSLGLPDAQVYFNFNDLEVGRLASLLFDLAAYIFNGVEIQAGHTVQGITVDQRWRASPQTAWAKPDRLVINLDAGHAIDARPLSWGHAYLERAAVGAVA